MSYHELIPIGTVVALLTKQVIKTALAAKDVVFEKESFKTLSKFLLDIEPVLKELTEREVNDSQAARKALKFLEEDVKKANDLVDKYKDRARFYLLLKCRHIVKEVQDVTRDIGRSLAGLSLASTEVLTNISEQVNRLHTDMQRAEFETSQTHLQIVQKLTRGLEEQTADQGFANDILEQIARAVGVPIEPEEISKELASVRQEKEDAAASKNRAEEYFLKQVIDLLSRADAAKNQEEIKKRYFLRVETAEKIMQEITPLQSFICPIKGRDVMVDPVSLCTGTTCERAAIESWFEQGKRIDPKTGDPLDDLSLRSNHRLRESIEEWRELNNCLKIRVVKRKLQSEVDSTLVEALVQMQEMMMKSPITKDWIAIEGLIEMCLLILERSHNKDVKRRVLVVLKAIVEDHITNKEKLIESQGIHHIVPCLGRSSNVSKAAVELLFDLLHDGNEWNVSASKKLAEESSAIIFLVMLMNKESMEKAKTILLKLCNDDDKNVIRAAKANWYKPLIDRLLQGQQSSRILMVKALNQMELVDQSLKSIGEAGAIPPLLEMVSGNIGSKELALSALVRLSTCYENKKAITASGGVLLVIKNLLSSQASTVIITRCCEILENLSSNDDCAEFFIDVDGSFLKLDEIVTYLLSLSYNTNATYRKPALSTLLGICKWQEKIVAKAVVSDNGVFVVLPLLDDPDQEIREVSVKLLFHFSRHDPQEIVQFLLVQRNLALFMGFLEDDSKNVQMAAVGLLANLPKAATELTQKLIESNVLPEILRILRSGCMEAKENALGVLFRFTDPINRNSQRMVVELGVYPLLVSLLKSGTVTAKARAAALIGDLSLSSHFPTATPKPPSLFWRTNVPKCEVHGGICSVTTTFCIVKGNALPEIVRLLYEKVSETAYEALQALLTLFGRDEHHRGAKVLHVANAISPILEVLEWGTPFLKEKALDILDKVFLTEEMVRLYGTRARIPLVVLTTRNIRDDGQLRRKAARVLARIESSSVT